MTRTAYEEALAEDDWLADDEGHRRREERMEREAERTTMTSTTTPTIDRAQAGQAVRAFLRAHSREEGALDALDALQVLESAADDTRGSTERRVAFNAAIIAAQHECASAVKSTYVKLGDGPGKGYSVAETEQILKIAKDAMAAHGLALALGTTEIIVAQGVTLLRVRLGIRHALGHEEWSTQDWPIRLTGQAIPDSNARRGAETSAIGYYLRGQLGMERDKADGEAAAAARAQSGPRGRYDSPRPAPTQPRPAEAPTPAAAPSDAPVAAPAPGPNGIRRLGEKAQNAVAKIRLATRPEQIDQVEGRLADIAAALDSDGIEGWTREDLAACREAVAAQRAELARSPS